MPATIFRTYREDIRVKFVYALTDKEIEKMFGDEKYIEAKVKRALARRHEPTENAVTEQRIS